eukprot:GHVP01031371.1.p1 GENE.GHVP01031371.1~~GHVP01031371.1.p1  ORF type:complete len:471 (-),score=72.53 GHVP01031371.1:20-1432(-)
MFDNSRQYRSFLMSKLVKEEAALREAVAAADAYISSDFVKNRPIVYPDETDITIWGDTSDLEVSTLSGTEAEPKRFRNIEFPNENIVNIVSGKSHILFLTAHGSVLSLGNGLRGQLGLGETRVHASAPKVVPELRGVVSIACGDEHSVALTREGNVACWGSDFQCGMSSCVDRFVPDFPLFLCDAVPLEEEMWDSLTNEQVPLSTKNHTIVCIASLGESSLAASDQNVLFAWGHSYFCRTFLQPQPVYRHSKKIVQIGMGKDFCLILDEEGSCFVFGSATYGELGNCPYLKTKDFYKIEIPPIAEISTGWRHSLLKSKANELWSFGDNLVGQCGRGQQQRICRPAIVPLSAGGQRKRCIAVYAGARHSVAVVEGGLCFIWGHGGDHKLIVTMSATVLTEQRFNAQIGQMGLAVRSGIGESIFRPRLVYALVHKRILSISVGEKWTVVVTDCHGPIYSLIFDRMYNLGFRV